MKKKKAGSHQSQDTKTKAFGLRIDPIYFFPVTEYCLQEVYSLSSVTKGKCDNEHRAGLNTAGKDATKGQECKQTTDLLRGVVIRKTLLKKVLPIEEEK